ncbi:hypothetical protein [Eubacterium sp. 1001713B170207_170306_E7]|uniref:hypothetical protein n=1 Tax=Eubacterium sp. 1001713B170207_170306_E7 TaxID=2787097 RepID=UPI00189B136D|nr:hypothetical protein [Eubacterium sp. 1001713B170207_170306_E7]
MSRMTGQIRKIPLLLTALLLLAGMHAVWAADMNHPVETSILMSISPASPELGQAFYVNAEVCAQSMTVVENGRVEFYLVDDDSKTERLIGAAEVKAGAAKIRLKSESSGYPSQSGTYTLIARYRTAEGGCAGSETRCALDLSMASDGPAGLITGISLASESSVLLAAGGLLLILLLMVLWRWLLGQERQGFN